MPPRSNILQRLVVEIHKDLGAHWNVVESRPLTDARTGQEREVDVIAQGTVGGYPITISIEVRDRGRPADVCWVESMVQKHADLPTTKLILWSSSGFTAAARRKAESLKAEAIRPTDGTNVQWAKLARDIVGGFLKVVDVKFDTAIDVSLEDGRIARWSADGTTTLISEDGAAAARVEVILAQAVPHLRKMVLDHAKEGTGDFLAEYAPPIQCTVVGPAGQTGRVRRVIFSMATRTDTAPLDTRSVLRGETVVSIAEARFDEGDVRLLARETEDGPPVISAIRLPKTEHRRR
jgi:hypothetical protein